VEGALLSQPRGKEDVAGGHSFRVILPQQRKQQPSHRLRQRQGYLDIPVAYDGDEVAVGLLVERVLTHQHGVQDHAQRPHVRRFALVRLLGAQQFWSGVQWATDSS